jgi:hypothetical protein
MPGLPRTPHQLVTLDGRRLLELPVTTVIGLGRLWPAGGGGYARLWPLAVLKRAIRQMNALGAPSVFYMHPYEYNPTELEKLPVRIPLRTRIHQSLGRRRFRQRVDLLLAELPFGTVAQWRAAAGPLKTVDVCSIPSRAANSSPSRLAAANS